MIKIVKKQNPEEKPLASCEAGIFLQWVSWHFFEVPKEILKAWKNFLKFNLNYFSIPLLLKTLSSPWHKYQWRYPRRFDIRKYLEVFLSNLISRTLGAIARILLIFIGFLAEVCLIFSGIIVFIGWLILPMLLALGLWFGFKIIF